MSVTFTKLFSSITESTVWCEPDRTRLVWITMLAMADRRGRIWASIPGLANRARVPVADCETAINTLLSPDSYSRTPDHEGRRIEPIDGGWQLLNYQKYRDMRDQETTREVKRRYMREVRSRQKQTVNIRADKVEIVDTSNPQWNKAEAEGEAVPRSTVDVKH